MTTDHSSSLRGTIVTMCFMGCKTCKCFVCERCATFRKVFKQAAMSYVCLAEPAIQLFGLVHDADTWTDRMGFLDSKTGASGWFWLLQFPVIPRDRPFLLTHGPALLRMWLLQQL